MDGLIVGTANSSPNDSSDDDDDSDEDPDNVTSILFLAVRTEPLVNILQIIRP